MNAMGTLPYGLSLPLIDRTFCLLFLRLPGHAAPLQTSNTRGGSSGANNHNIPAGQYRIAGYFNDFQARYNSFAAFPPPVSTPAGGWTPINDYQQSVNQPISYPPPAPQPMNFGIFNGINAGNTTFPPPVAPGPPGPAGDSSPNNEIQQGQTPANDPQPASPYELRLNEEGSMYNFFTKEWNPAPGMAEKGLGEPTRENSVGTAAPSTTDPALLDSTAATPFPAPVPPTTPPAGEPTPQATPEVPVKRGRGRPLGSKNRDKDAPPPVKIPKKRGRPEGSKNKPKDPNAPPKAKKAKTGGARPVTNQAAAAVEEQPRPVAEGVKPVEDAVAGESAPIDATTSGDFNFGAAPPSSSASSEGLNPVTPETSRGLISPDLAFVGEFAAVNKVVPGGPAPVETTSDRFGTAGLELDMNFDPAADDLWEGIPAPDTAVPAGQTGSGLTDFDPPAASTTSAAAEAGQIGGTGEGRPVEGENSLTGTAETAPDAGPQTRDAAWEEEMFGGKVDDDGEGEPVEGQDTLMTGAETSTVMAPQTAFPGFSEAVESFDEYAARTLTAFNKGIGRGGGDKMVGVEGESGPVSVGEGNQIVVEGENGPVDVEVGAGDQIEVSEEDKDAECDGIEEIQIDPTSKFL